MKPLLKWVLSLVVIFVTVTVVLIAAFPVSKIRVTAYNITNQLSIRIINL